MKPIEQIAEEKKFLIGTRKEDIFLSGFTYAKDHPELLRELFEEFAEWIKRQPFFTEDYINGIVDKDHLVDSWLKSRKTITPLNK